MNTKNRSVGDRVFDGSIYIILSLTLVLILFPLYFVVIASISDPTLVNLGEVWFYPRNITFEGYNAILSNSDVWTGYRNTIFYTAAGTTLNLALTLTSGYALSRKDLVGRNIFMGILTFTMFFSGGLIPFYFLIKNLKMINTFWVMIIPGAVSVMNVIIARTFFQSTIPDELHEAAVIDGCNDTYFFIKIVLPLSKAIVAVLTLYYAVGHWNAFFNAMIFLKERSMYPLQLILREILVQNQMAAEELRDSVNAAKALDKAEVMKYGLIIVSSLPVLVLYPFLQKYFMKGVMIGAIKG